MATPAHFSATVLGALRQAGWRPDRSVDTAHWIDVLEREGYQANEAATAALGSFGGLVIEPVNTEGPNFRNVEPLDVDPILAGSGHRVLADELTGALGGQWFPFAEWLSSSSVFVRGDGWVVATGLGWIWELGRGVPDAIEFAVTAHRPLRCLAVLAPGAQPWP